LISLFALLFLTGLTLIGMSFWMLRAQKLPGDTDNGLLYAIMHDELSNPLQTVLASLSNISVMNSGGAVIQREDLDAMNNKLNRLVSVTRDLKVLAAQDAGGVYQRKELIDLAAIAQRTILDLANSAERQQVLLTYTGVESAQKMLGSCVNLERVVRNLIENAIKYSRLDLPNPAVLISVECLDGSVVLRVEDNGQGMSAERVSSLGVKSQLRSLRTLNTEGTGLGWLLVKSVVDSHQGVIKVNSSPNQGTRVALVFSCANSSFQ